MRRLAAALALSAASCAGTEHARSPEPDWSAVRAELARRVEVDQELRRAATSSETMSPELVDRVVAVDADNTAWMRELVARHGWPTVPRVGAEGAGNAWLLVQHADQDVEFQEHCLQLLRAAAARGEVDRKHLAYLEDRVAAHRGRPQRYGTQFTQKDGELVPCELEDPARVDEWRAEVGLGTLAEYAELLKEQ